MNGRLQRDVDDRRRRGARHAWREIELDALTVAGGLPGDDDGHRGAVDVELNEPLAEIVVPLSRDRRGH
jgi:hypothetical protein